MVKARHQIIHKKNNTDTHTHTQLPRTHPYMLKLGVYLQTLMLICDYYLFGNGSWLKWRMKVRKGMILSPHFCVYTTRIDRMSMADTHNHCTFVRWFR